MHGRKKGSATKTPADKIDKYNKLKRIILAKHAAKVYTPTMHGLNQKLIRLNPDFYTLWNYERLIALDSVAQFGAQPPSEVASSEGPSAAEQTAHLQKVMTGELQLVESALARNHKSYYAWYHRQWAITQLGAEADLKQELLLCTKLLNMDARNFHCWNYRRWIASKSIPLQVCSLTDELEFTGVKINQNFSNYSAWHYRSSVLHQMHIQTTTTTTTETEIETDEGKEKPFVLQEVLEGEFALVKEAMFVDPHDQSAWLYHRWLLSCVVSQVSALQNVLGVTTEHVALAPLEGNDNAWTTQQQHGIFKQELAVMQELKALDPDCKWVLLSLVILVCLVSSTSSETYTDSATGLNRDETITQVVQQLVSLDSQRTQYYLDVRKSLLASSQ
jgi:geranylgeranyl transferase type-2 subunit alpha